MSETNGRTFATKDIELAAYLHAREVKITDVRKNEANKTVFVFTNDEGGTQKTALSFYNHDDQISASKLLWSFQQIKSMVFDPNLERPPIAKART
jgi:hypothetical protein